MLARGAPWPLTERGDTIEATLDLLRAGRNALIAGPAGIGKTRLVQTVADHLTDRGSPVLRVRANPASRAVPLLAVSHLAGREATSDPVDLFRAIRDAVEGPPTTLLIVDDAHWLDDASAALLDQLADTTDIVLLATARTGSDGVPAAVSRWLHGDQGAQLELQPLSRESVDGLLGEVLGAPVEPSTTARLHHASAGVPLMLRELTIAALDQDKLELVGGAWYLRGAATPSGALVDIVADRVRTCTDEARAVVEFVAVAGALPKPTVERLVSPTALVAAEAAELVDVDLGGGDHQVRPFHPVYGEAVLQRMVATRRSEIASLLAADAEERQSERPADLVRLCLWKLDAGQQPTADQLTEALRSTSGLERSTARRLAAAAVHVGVGPRALIHTAQVHVGDGEIDEAIALLRSALELTLATADRVDGEPPAEGEHVSASVSSVRTFAGTYLAFQFLLRTQLAEGITVLDRIDPMITTEDRWHSGELRLQLETWKGPSDRAVTARRDFLAAVPAHRRDRTLITSSGALAHLIVSGLGAEAAVDALETHAAVGRMPQRSGTAAERPLGIAALAEIELCRLDQASAFAQRALDGCTAVSDDSGTLTATLALGRLAMHRGDIDEARRRFLQASSLASSIDDAARSWALGGLAHALAFSDDGAAAATALAELDAEPVVEPVFDGEFCDRGRLWAMAVTASRADAVEFGLIAAERERLLQHRTVEAALIHDLARLGHLDGAAERLEQLVAQTDSGLVPLRLTHVSAIESGDPHRLLAAAEAFASHGVLLLAAEAALAAAASFSDDGPRAASAARSRADALLDRCPGAAIPLVLAAGVPSGHQRLTPREREIAAMAATGQPSKEIASRLGVSVRTINNLLQRCYVKLGVSNRADLRDALEQRTSGGAAG